METMAKMAELMVVPAFIEANSDEFTKYLEDKDLADGFKKMVDDDDIDYAIGAVGLPVLLPFLVPAMDGEDQRIWCTSWLENKHEELGKMMDAMYLGVIYYAHKFYEQEQANAN